MVYNRYLEQGGRLSNILSFLKRVFSLKNILFAVLSFALSSLVFAGEFTPFGYVMFGVASVFNVPLLLVLIFSVLGMLSAGLKATLLIKLLAFFGLFTFITALVNIQGVSKRYSVFFKFMISAFIVEIVSNFIEDTLFTNIIGILSSLAIFATLYFVFLSGMHVLINLNKGYVYSKEENVAMIAVIAIALTIFKDVQVLGISVFNVLVLIMAILFAWKKGPVYGGATGLVIGLLLTCLMEVSMTYIVVLAFSSLVSGVLSKFGRIAVVIGFLAGNIYIIYYANEFSELTVRITELLIASVPLLLVPKAIEQKLVNLFNKNMTLNKTYENVLDEASSVRKKVDAVSEVFESLSDTYYQNTGENLEENREVIKRYLEEYTYNTCIDCKRKKDCISEEKLDLIVDHIATKLENNEKLDKKMLRFECENSEEIVESLQEIYDSMKLMRMLKAKEKESSEKISKQYKEVSKILSNISKNIKNANISKTKEQKVLAEELKFYGYIVYEDYFEKDDNGVEYTFVTDILTDIDKQKKQIVNIVSEILEQDMVIKLILNSSKKEKSRIKLVSTPAFEIQTGIIGFTKNDESKSGDSYLSYELTDLKHINMLSDGAGSGSSASHSSKTVISLLEKLIAGGFDEKKAIEIINSVIKLKADDTEYSSLDTAVIDLRTAETTFIKLGSAPTYVVEDGRVITINNLNIPVGLLKEADYVPITKTLKDSSIIVQLTDGAISEDLDINDNYLTRYLQEVDSGKSAKAIADDIGNVIAKEYNNSFEDDVTVIVTKVKKVNSKI